MKVLAGVFRVFFGFLWVVGVVSNGLLFLYVEWSYLRESFFQLFNPLLHLQVMLTLLTMPLFWILTAAIAIGYMGMNALGERIEG